MGRQSILIFIKGPLLTFTTGHSNPLVQCLGRAQCLLIADFQYIHSALAHEFFFARKWLWVPNGHRPKRRCQTSVRQRSEVNLLAMFCP